MLEQTSGSVVLIKIQAGKEEMVSKEVLPLIEKLFKENYCNKRYITKHFCSDTNNKDIVLQVKEEQENNPDKIIVIFVYKMLETAITIPGCFCTILMDNDYNSDSYYQFMMRCFTPEKGKPVCFVVDANPFRRTNFQLNYTIKANKNKNLYNITSKITDLFDIYDSDLEIKISNERLDCFLQYFYQNCYSKNNFKKIQLVLEENLKLGPIKKIKTNITLAKEEEIESTERLQEISYKEDKIETENTEENVSNKNSEVEKEEENNKEVFGHSLKVLAMYYILQNLNLDAKLTEEMYKNLRKYMVSIYKNFFTYNDYIFNLELNLHIFYSFLSEFRMQMENKPMEDKLKVIMEFLKPNEYQKKQTGEVYTPPDLINEMLDKLEEYNPSIFSDPDKTWYDNSCGIGNFLVFVYLRLNKGLETVIKDPLERKNHILNRMIYGVDICPLNISICKFLLGCRENDNIICGDGLSQETHKGMTFDIIVGNPPYQKVNASGDNKLYLSFTGYNVKILKKNGYLLYITPRTVLDYLLNFKAKNRDYIDKLYQIKHISIETISSYFVVGSTFIYFLLQNSDYAEETNIEYIFNNFKENNKVNLRYLKQIPKRLSLLDLSLIKKITSLKDVYILKDFQFNNRTRRIRKEHILKGLVTTKETKTHNIKIIDTINKTNPFPGKYYFYNEYDNDYSKNKIVISKKGYLSPVYDDTHIYTYSDNFKYILENKNLIYLINSNIVKYLLFQYSKNGFDNINIVQMLKKINLEDLDSNQNIEQQIYNKYKLTKEEIELIESFVN